MKSKIKKMEAKKISPNIEFSSTDFKQQVMNEIEYRKNLIKEAKLKFKRIRRTTEQRLIERNVFDETMVDLYEKVLEKNLDRKSVV